MAGRGPAPQETRRRSNEPARGDWIDLPPLEKLVLPALPKRARGQRWSARTRGVWNAWRHDPVTVMWSPADVAYALETILLVEAATPSSMSEIRLRMDGLGLTPKGKRDLRWRVSDSRLPSDGPPRSTFDRSAGSSRRARLSIVK